MSLPESTRIGRIELRVADLSRSLAFYRDLLGLVEYARTTDRCELGPHGGRPLISLLAVPGTRLRPAGVVGLFHYALLLPHRRDLGRVLLHLFQARYPFQGFADHLVSEAAYLADPDGNGIELYADRPREDWQRRDNQIEMSTLALNVNSLLRSVEGEEWRGIAAGTGMGHVHLHVADLARTGAFYREVVGFDVTNNSFPSALFLAAGGYHHHLGLNTWLRPENANGPDAANMLSWELVLPHPAHSMAIAERALKWGSRVEEKADQTIIVDPDGMQVIVTT
ncbi:MAG: VOC family protein [Longimicrobiales bacterium]